MGYHLALDDLCSLVARAMRGSHLLVILGARDHFTRADDFSVLAGASLFFLSAGFISVRWA